MDGVAGSHVAVVDREYAAVGLGTNRSWMALGVTATKGITDRQRLKLEIHDTASSPMPSTIRATPVTSDPRARALLPCLAKDDFNLLVPCQPQLEHHFVNPDNSRFGRRSQHVGARRQVDRHSQQDRRCA